MESYGKQGRRGLLVLFHPAGLMCFMALTRKNAETPAAGISAHIVHSASQRRKRPLCLSPPPCNSPDSRHKAYALRLQPTFSESLPMADFRPTAHAASVHPCAHSAVRVGFRTPFLLNCLLTLSGPLRQTATQHPRTLFTFSEPWPILIIYSGTDKVNSFRCKVYPKITVRPTARPPRR